MQERVGFWEGVKKGGLISDMSPGSPHPPPIERQTPPPLRCPPPHRVRDREELLATTALGGQVKRVGPGRWTAAAERRFFDELAATANVKRACAAAGVSAPTRSMRGG